MNWKQNARETINTWKAKIEHLRVRAKLLQMELKDEYDDRIAQLQQRWQKLETDMDRWEDNAETRWDNFKEEFESDMDELGHSLERLLDGKDDDDKIAAKTTTPATTATATDPTSEGWIEGMGHDTTNSEGWVEGKGHDTTNSEGWVEGMARHSSGESDKEQRTRPKPM